MKQHHSLGALVLVVVPIAALLVGVAMSPVLGVTHVTIVAPTASLGEEVRQQMRLPDKFVQGTGTHPLGKGRLGFLPEFAA